MGPGPSARGAPRRWGKSSSSAPNGEGRALLARAYQSLTQSVITTLLPTEHMVPTNSDLP